MAKDERFLVHRETVSGPATHAIVIGVGSYPYLSPSVAADPNEHSSLPVIRKTLEPLSSPPRSATMFADWLVSHYTSADKPLATVSLLVSEPTDFLNARTKQKVAVHAATMDNLTDALRAWKSLGDEDEAHRLIFFFSGHGLAQGSEQALLLENFGADIHKPFRHALDFTNFRLGMAACRARQQCYFVDACRAATEILDEIDLGGDEVISPARKNDPSLPLRLAPVFFSTLEGASSFGPANPAEPSYFTKALLGGLKSTGAQQIPSGKWAVTTNSLKLAIDDQMILLHKKGLPQLPSNDGGADFELHHLSEEPRAPVSVGCSRADADPHATLHCEGHSTSPSTEPRPWQLELPPGAYVFDATFPASSGWKASKTPRWLIAARRRRVSVEVSKW
jgi:hypothetical protein